VQAVPQLDRSRQQRQVLPPLHALVGYAPPQLIYGDSQHLGSVVDSPRPAAQDGADFPDPGGMGFAGEKVDQTAEKVAHHAVHVQKHAGG
jgi:hypothetical protein